MNELRLYIDYLKEEIRRTRLKLANHPPAYFETFRENLLQGVAFYRRRIEGQMRHGREAFAQGMEALVAELEAMTLPANQVTAS